METKVEEVHKNGVRLTRRLWRDALQTMEMLRKGLKDYTDPTRPIAVNTMQLLVGDESLQFRFVASRQNLTVVSPVSYNERLGRLEVASATLDSAKAYTDTVAGGLVPLTDTRLSDPRDAIQHNGGGSLKLWAGTRAEYDALPAKADDTLYFIR